MKRAIKTNKAPSAIGTYSQAIKHGGLLCVSGQIPISPITMTLVKGGIDQQIDQVLKNLTAIAHAADVTLNETIKFTVYLTELSHSQKVNEAMTSVLIKPYPARVALEVSKLPQSALVEIDAIIAVN